MKDIIVEIDAPSFEELTKEQYNKILDSYGEYQRKIIEKIKENDTYIENIEREKQILKDKIYDLKSIIQEIIERI